MKKGFLFSPLLFLFSCATGVNDWHDAYKYQSHKDWSLEKERAKLPDNKVKEEKEDKSLYEKEVEEKLTKLLRTEPTPLRVPDTIVRVLILPYVDESGNLVSQKYVFFRAEEGKWILGEYLLQRGKPIKEFKPLEEKTDDKK